MRKIWYQAYSSARRFIRHPRSNQRAHWQLQDKLLDDVAKYPRPTLVWEAANNFTYPG